MKIGIITFHAAFNYGSMLQAYAMQTFLERQGHQVEIINFRPEIQKKAYSKPLKWNNKGNIILSFKRLLFTPIEVCKLYKKWNLFNSFLHKYLNLSKEYNSIDELIKDDIGIDLLITGSDQIWNTNAFDFSEVYFGNFLNSDIPKIAYAPSMGPSPETQDVKYLKKLLQGYRAVSVREERTKQFIEDYGIFKNVEIVLDPTMLLDGCDYDLLYGKEPLIKEDYIFYYTPGGARHEFLQIAENIGEKYNLPVIVENSYTPGDLKRYKHIKAYAAVGPSEFLNLVKNSKVVCGASFHLMVFAVLFNKKFFCINGDVDSRLNNLMKITGNQDCIISIQSPINIQKTESYLEDIRKHSENFLVDSINSISLRKEKNDADY